MTEKTRLALVPVSEEQDAAPAAMHELAAARYIGMNRTAFRDLVFSGIIPYSMHLNGVRRIYLKSDLDCYLKSLPRRRMTPRGNSLEPAPKGVGKDER